MSKRGSECKKADWNEVKCKNYFSQGRREKNKLRRLYLHLQDQPNDLVAQKSSEATKKMMKGERAWKKRA